jgi:transposase
VGGAPKIIASFWMGFSGSPEPGHNGGTCTNISARVIPTRRNRKLQIPADGHIHALRNRIERCFNKLKNARRRATRYDKTKASYLGFVQIAAIAIMLR